MAHPEQLTINPASWQAAIIGEYTSTTVLTAPLPGDLWST
jgi:hypothetical protein